MERNYVTVALCIYIIIVFIVVSSDDSSLPRTDQSDTEALKEPSSMSEDVMKSDKRPRRRRSALFLLLILFCYCALITISWTSKPTSEYFCVVILPI